MKHIRKLNEDIVTNNEREELKNASVNLTDMGFSMEIKEEDVAFRQEVRSHTIIYKMKNEFKWAYGSEYSYNARYSFIDVDDVSNNIKDYGIYVKEVTDVIPEVMHRIIELGFNICYLYHGLGTFGEYYTIKVRIKKDYI